MKCIYKEQCKSVVICRQKEEEKYNELEKKYGVKETNDKSSQQPPSA